MKKYLFIVLLLPFVAFSQQKYFTYQYNSLYGITDANGTNVIDAQYEDLNNRESDSLVILKNYEGERKTLVFNLFTGVKKEYDKIVMNDTYIQNEFFSLIENDKKQYLLGQKSGFVIQFKEYHYQLRNLGSDYIAAKIKKQKIIKPVPKDNNGNEIPQIRTIDKDYYYIYKNDRKLTIIKEFALQNSLMPFEIYKEKPLEKTDNIVLIAENHIIDLRMDFVNEKFDYVSVRKDDYWELYDKKWTLIKKMYPKGDDDMQDVVTKAVQGFVKGKKNVIVERLSRDTPPNMATVEGRDFLKIEAKNDVNFVSCLKNDNYFFLFKTTSKVSSSYNRLTFEDAKNNKMVLDVDESNFKMHLPTQYQEQFKISFEK